MIRAFFIILLLAATPAQALDASFCNRFFGKLAQWGVEFRNRNADDLSGQTYTGIPESSPQTPVSIHFENVVGSGFFGKAYHVTVTGQDTLAQGGPKIAKISLKANDRLSKRSLNSEYDNYRSLKHNQDAIIAAQGLDHQTAWGENLPVVPILEKINSSTGPVLIKPLVHGRSINSFHSLDELTSDMKQGLKDILNYVKATDTVVPGGYATDLRPTNLLWVEDPDVLKVLGYSKPGWVLFEQDQALFKVRYYVNITYERYLTEIETYLKKGEPQNEPALVSVPKVAIAGLTVALAKAKGNIFTFMSGQHEKHGETFSVTSPLKKRDLIFTADPLLAKQVLVDTDRNENSTFTKNNGELRPLTKVAGKNNLFTAPLNEWRLQRKQLAPSFTPQKVTQPDYSAKVGEIVDAKLNAIQSKMTNGTTKINYEDFISETALDVILRLLFNYQSSPDELANLAKQFALANESVVAETLNPFGVPVHELPNILPLQSKLKKAYADKDKLVDSIMSQLEKNPEQAQGFMGLLMSMRNGNGDLPTPQEIRDQILVFIFAGHETTAHTLTWEFNEIFANARIQTKLTELVRSGNEEAANAYIDQIWLESLRLHMPITLIPRTAKKAVTIKTSKGLLKVQEHSTIILNTSVIAHREDIWGVEKTGFPADEFHPERFAKENMEAHGLKAEDVETFALGFGPRICIGLFLARAEARKITKSFFKQFNPVGGSQYANPTVSWTNQRLISPTEVTLQSSGGSSGRQ